MGEESSPGKRYWCPRLGTISLNDNGFIVDPESESKRYFSTEIVSLAKLRDTNCLVLLGEPQAGKTNSVSREIALLSEGALSPEGMLSYWDLSEYSDETRLVTDVFRSDRFREWLSSGRKMYLFLDQLDTCMKGMPTLPAMLKARINEVRSLSNKLYIRLVARTGLWPEFLTGFFESIWGKERVGVYEIAPIGRAEVSRTAEGKGLKAQDFVERVVKRDLQPLASHPLTLNFLLENYDQNQGFTKPKGWLYLNCTRLLCSDFDATYHGSLTPARLSPARRLSLASRIAAALVFSNRTAIRIDPTAEDISDTDIAVRSLEEGEESTGSQAFSFTEADVLDVLQNTALFSGRGPNRLGFVSRSIQEFLAARYLALHQLSVQQIKALTQVSAAPNEMVVPQLRQTIGWLGSVMPDLLSQTIKTDPKSILSGAVDDLETRFRKDIVESFLKQLENREIADLDWGDYSQYHKLNHPGIASQLTPFIADKDKYFVVRRVAIDIAEACGVSDASLHALLAGIALDESDDVHIRDRAAHAISQIGNRESRLLLKSLVTSQNDKDVDDQLKGSALFALWPHYLSISEVFSALKKPRKESFFGTYAFFFSILHNNLRKDDLPIALKWVADNPAFAGRDIGTYYDLAERILGLAWRHMEDQRVVDEYARAVVPRLANYRDVRPRHIYGDTDSELPELAISSRRALTKAIVALLDSYRPFLLVPAMNAESLIKPEDFQWMIGELIAENDPVKKGIWAGIVHDAFRPDRLDQVEAVIESALHDAVIANKFSGWLQPIALASDAANAARANLSQMKELQAEQLRWKQEEEKLIVPSVRDRIEKCLQLFESGDMSGWWRLCMEMTLDEKSKSYGDEFDPDLTALPGWKNVDGATLERITSAAETFLVELNPEPELWLGRSDIFHRPAVAGVKALVVLRSHKKEAFLSLGDVVWRKWVSAIVDYPTHHNRKATTETYPALITQAYQAAPQELVSSLIAVIDKEDKSLGHLFCLIKIRECMDIRLQTSLCDRAKRGFASFESLKELLSLLIEFKNLNARSFAESLLTPQGIMASERSAKAAALALLVEADDGGWNAVWPAIRDNPEWGKELLLELPDSLRGSRVQSIAERIGWLRSAELFLWLYKHFPMIEDNLPEGAHFVAPRESIAYFRDGLLANLRDSGTPESLQALERIAQALPELAFMPFYVIKARENLRRHIWSPLLPEELFMLVRSPFSRLVLNSDHLVDALIESLIRLEERLQGHTPMAFVLWDRERSGDKMRPKSEAELSDVIKDHLSHDLRRHALVALREVEIRRTQTDEGQPGERVDIYVEGLVRHTEQRVSTVIEVKGCWHPHIRTAMKQQLMDRYMNETGCDRGIYLVGWFRCDPWDQRDRRKNRTGAKSLIEARKLFYDMAESLESGIKRIKSCVLNCALR